MRRGSWSDGEKPTSIEPVLEVFGWKNDHRLLLRDMDLTKLRKV